MRFITISDIHIGHNKVYPETIWNNLKEYLYPHLKDIDVLFICGDYFETILSIDDKATYCGIMIMSEIFNLAIEYKFKVRILRGTVSHDRNQNKIFNSIITNLDQKIDYKYFDILDFEYMEDLDLKILYLPDELPYKDSNDCLSLIKNRMTDLNWDTIDIVIGHGNFEHAMPYGMPLSPKMFRAEQFKNIVKGKIFMGHIHSYSAYKNIVYNGSFDRLRHGEEESKGFIITQVDSNKNYKSKFIENKNATKFISLTLPSTDDFDMNVNFVDKYISDNFTDYFLSNQPLYIRILHPDITMRDVIKKSINSKYPLKVYVTSISTNKKEYEKLTVDQFLTDVMDEVIPTKDNICELVSEYLSKEVNFDIDKKQIENLIRTLDPRGYDNAT